MKRKWAAGSWKVAIAMVLALGTATVHGATVTFSFTAPDRVRVGDTFSIEIVGESDGVAPILGGALDFLFDAAFLQVSAVTLLAPTDVAGRTGSVDNGSGVVETIAFASFDGVTDSFSYALVEFDAIAIGAATLAVADSNDLVFPWFDANAEAVDVISMPAEISIVPVPAAVWMFGAGLALLGSRFRRS